MFKKTDLTKEEVKKLVAGPLLQKSMLNVVRGISHFGLQFPQPTAVPVVIVWNYTNRCNLNCLHCHQNSGVTDERELTTEDVFKVIDKLGKAGLLTSGNGRRYRLRAHSLRKYFRTQLAALGMNTDYIEYMMGHKISTYHDVQMKGVEFLRGQYHASNLSIRPKTKVSKIEMVKAFSQGLGLDPEEILSRAS